MVKPQILDEKPINLVELRDEITKIQKKDKEMNFRVNKTYEYLNNVVTLSSTKSKELFKKLDGLKIPRLKEIHIHKIIDIMPVSIEELKTIVQSYTLTINKDNLKKIVDVVKEFNK